MEGDGEMKPLLSIGMIFKNEIRCLERCMKSLQPLRDAVPCELVMADTGSVDGSREIAEKYADILIDFPWINDFSAARNAVIDRSSGKWHFVIDTDEYLDENVTELLEFLRQDEKREKAGKAPDFGCVTVRNYATYDFDGPYSDFLSVRMVRMSSGIHYQGEVHEHWDFDGDELWAEPMPHVILHHDGYVGLDGEAGREKRERNIQLLRRELDEDPNNLRALMQFIDSGMTEPDYADKIRRSVELVAGQRCEGWARLGPSVLRNAIVAANKRDFPEIDEWIQKVEEMFPQSAFTLVDVNYVVALRCLKQKDYKGAISRGEQYLKALTDVRSGNLDPVARLYGILAYEPCRTEQEMRYCLANAYLQENNVPRALELMEALDYSCLDAQYTVSAVQVLRNLHFSTNIDTIPATIAMWNGITEPRPSAEKASVRKKAMLDACAALFSNHFRTAEKQDEGFCRPSYTLLLPLKEMCDLGKAAAIMESTEPAEMEKLLYEMENWMQVPNEVLLHALGQGMTFPLANCPLNVEEMDGLAARLAKDVEHFIPLALRTAEQANAEDWQGLCWVRGLLLAAVRAYPWNSEDQDEEQGMAVARVFAQVEREFLPRCYSTDVLREDRLFVLPPLHRFGWYCAQAFDVLKSGDAIGYVRLLREGLDVCGGMKPMVSFLADHTQEVQQAMTTPELRALADQVRVVLARFAPDDPAVAELKQTDAYQKVAHLIEGVSVPVWGGQPQ